MYQIRKAPKQKINKSGLLRSKMFEVLPILDVNDSFDVPIDDFKGSANEFQKTVSTVLCKYVKHEEPSKKFKTRKIGDSKIEVSRIY